MHNLWKYIYHFTEFSLNRFTSLLLLTVSNPRALHVIWTLNFDQFLRLEGTASGRIFMLVFMLSSCAWYIDSQQRGRQFVHTLLRWPSYLFDKQLSLLRRTCRHYTKQTTKTSEISEQSKKEVKSVWRDVFYFFDWPWNRFLCIWTS